MEESRGSVSIRRHPLIVLRNFFVLEFASVVFFYIAAGFANYEHVYDGLPFNSFLSYRIAEFLFITFAELLIVSFIFLTWFFETYEFVPSGIIHRWGIIVKGKKVFTFSASFTVSVIQGPIDRILRLGTLAFQDSLSKTAVRLTHITNPSHYADLFQRNTQPAITPESFSRVDLLTLLGERESETLEFKTTFRWDTREKKVSKEMEHMVIKTISAFLNSKGGHLIIGVDDHGKALGLGDDYKTLKKPSSDGFELHFTTIFNNYIGAESRDLVKLEFPTVAGKEVVMVHVLPSPKPVYTIFEKGEHFYVRTGNATTDMTMRQAAAYIESHWRR